MMSSSTFVNFWVFSRISRSAFPENQRQFRQLCDDRRTVYLTFDADSNGSGQQAAQRLSQRLREQGIATRRVSLPEGHDPNSFFLAGGDAQGFHHLLQEASL